ncbi:cytochrome c oxidase subunit 3 [Marinicaulis aureus]|uniref:Cytochrome c oxidase subunit 3 n=1 Tax=Hyphococcus aureus TaxID=2666033 RepID=A0ABW1KY53_9PROT
MTGSSKRILRMPGEAGVWSFVLADMTMFACFFVAFLWYRHSDPSGYANASQQLNLLPGVCNTLLLVTSSWRAATAVNVLRSNACRSALANLTAAISLGGAFCVIKLFEYAGKAQQHISVTTHDFFAFYYIFTGIHLIHVAVGMGILLWLRRLVKISGHTPETLQHTESGAIYWHMVDLLWLILFALFYVMK